jgi:DNA replication protein DnaC
VSDRPERARGGRLEGSLPSSPPPDTPLVAVPGGMDAGVKGPDALARREPKERSCPFGVCDGSGWIVDEETNEASACRCRERIVERVRARGIAATLPKRFRGVSFDRPPVSDMARDPNTRHQVAEVRAFAEGIDARLDQGSGLWLQGSTGTGKTTLAMLVSKAALDANRTAAIYSLPQLLARIRRTFDGEAGGDSYSTFFNKLVSVDLLHLDDLGAENRTEWVLEQLYSIIDRRYNDQRSIVVTTNLEEPQLYAQLGDRIVSRLTEICGDPLVLRGKDRRVELAPGPADLDASA